MSLLVGLDLGTTAIKAVALDPEIGIVSTSSTAMTLHSKKVGWAEVQPLDWLRGATGLIGDLAARGGFDPPDIDAIACTGMVPAVTTLDGSGEPLRPAMLQNDARAGAEIDDLTARTEGWNLLGRTGSVVSQQSVAPTLLWLQRHEPAVLTHLRTVCGSYDYLATALGAERHVEANWALESGLFDLAGEHVLAEVLDLAGVEPAVLPPVRRSGDVVGFVNRAAAELSGMTAGTPIVVGGADHVLSAAAATVTSPGDWLVKLGGGGDILAAASNAVPDARLYLDRHPVEGLWLPNGCMATSGSLVRWVSDLTGRRDLVALGEQARVRDAGEVLCLPYFLGEKSPLHDTRLRGAFVGLDLAHDAATIFRAVLEAVAFGFRRHVEVFAELGIPLAESPRISNGGAGSPLWRRIHADVLGVGLVEVRNHPGASLGAALAAGIGTGRIESWAQAERYIALVPAEDPDPAAVRRYDEIYRDWLELSDVLTPLSHRRAANSQPESDARSCGPTT